MLVWAGMLCTIFSRARKRDGQGPGPLRDDFYLYGPPFLCRKDKAKVQRGNNHLAFLVRLLQICDNCQVPFIVEFFFEYVMEYAVARALFSAPMRFLCQLGLLSLWSAMEKAATLLYKYIDLYSLQQRCSEHGGKYFFSGVSAFT